jgi:hypothetical protein
VLETDTGELIPKQEIETGPVVYMCGVFKDYQSFRDFVLGVSDEDARLPRNHLEVVANSLNPVLSTDRLSLVLRNNRQNIREGEVAVSSPDGLFAGESQENPPETLREENAFLVSPAPDGSGIGLVDFTLELSGFEKKIRRALLITDDTKIVSDEQGGVLTVTNGKIRFMLSPGFSDAVYSLAYEEREWLFSRYPSIEPYSWWNPFIGGLKGWLENMGDSLVLREEITASFTSETDNFGNVWTGIRADVAVEKFNNYKGMRYSNYYLTLPGVPVLCHFMKLENKTGRYLDAEMNSLLFASGEEGMSDLCVNLAEENGSGNVLNASSTGEWVRYDCFASFSRKCENPRSEKLYVFRDSSSDRERPCFEYDADTACCDFSMKGSIPDSESHTTKPTFCILTEKDLSPESLEDLKRVEFL